MEFFATYHTDIGIKRKTNQDSLALRVFRTEENEQVAFAIVCDGMGGLKKGELASAEVVKSFCRWLENDCVPQIVDHEFDPATLKEKWTAIVQEENEKIKEYGKNENIMIGTTVSAILFFKDSYYIIHVGDSRIYELTETVKQLTTDQTLIEKEIAAGRITPEQAKKDKRQNILLQCIGASETVVPDFITGNIEHNAVYVLCSDGFRHQITEGEMLKQIGPNSASSKDTLKYGVYNLTECVKKRGETDNITSVLIYVK